MFDNYTEMDRLVLERWPDVLGLIDAHRAVQEHIEIALESVSDRIVRWVREQQGFDGELSARESELYIWHPNWYDKRKNETKVYLTLGGFCPTGFRKIDEKYPYVWLNTYPLERFKVKAPERIKFAQALRAALGDDARKWEDENIDDADHPLGQYLRQYDNQARARLVLDPDSLLAFFKQHLPSLFALVPVIDSELRRVSA